MIFPSFNFFVEKGLSTLVQKTLVKHVQLTSTTCLFVTCTFDLQMSKGVHDIFVIVVNFLDDDQQPKHVTIGLFETIYTSGVAMALKSQQFLDNFFLAQKVVAYVKDEGSNLQTCTTILNLMVSYNMLGMFESFDGSYFGHVLSKVGQYVIMDEKIFHGLSCTSINTTQFDIQNGITWPKKFGKGREGRERWSEAWDKASMDFRLRLRRLNTLVKTKYHLHLVSYFILFHFPFTVVSVSYSFGCSLIFFVDIVNFLVKYFCLRMF